jgi:hypothetical protein
MPPTNLSLRRDPEIDAALSALGDKYGNLSNTLKHALLQLAEATRRAALREEAAQLAADPDDQAEVRAVRAALDDARAW